MADDLESRFKDALAKIATKDEIKHELTIFRKVNDNIKLILIDEAELWSKKSDYIYFVDARNDQIKNIKNIQIDKINEKDSEFEFIRLLNKTKIAKEDKKNLYKEFCKLSAKEKKIVVPKIELLVEKELNIKIKELKSSQIATIISELQSKDAKSEEIKIEPEIIPRKIDENERRIVEFRKKLKDLGAEEEETDYKQPGANSQVDYETRIFVEQNPEKQKKLIVAAEVIGELVNLTKKIEDKNYYSIYTQMRDFITDNKVFPDRISRYANFNPGKEKEVEVVLKKLVEMINELGKKFNGMEIKASFTIVKSDNSYSLTIEKVESKVPIKR